MYSLPLLPNGQSGRFFLGKTMFKRTSRNQVPMIMMKIIIKMMVMVILSLEIYETSIQRHKRIHFNNTNFNTMWYIYVYDTFERVSHRRSLIIQVYTDWFQQTTDRTKLHFLLLISLNLKYHWIQNIMNAYFSSETYFLWEDFPKS